MQIKGYHILYSIDGVLVELPREKGPLFGNYVPPERREGWQRVKVSHCTGKALQTGTNLCMELGLSK